LVFDISTSMRSFDANTSDGLPEHFDDLPIIGMQFIPEILTRIHFWLFQRKGCEHARLTANVVKMYLCLGYFLRSNSICHHLVFYCVVTFLPVLDSPSRFRQHTRAADETTAAWNSCQSTCELHGFWSQNGSFETQVVSLNLSFSDPYQWSW